MGDDDDDDRLWPGRGGCRPLTVADLLRPLPEACELRQDPENTNQGTDPGRALIRQSMAELGFARPVFAAADGTIIGGNHAIKTVEELRAEGVVDFKEPIFVHTSGDRPIIHVRDDIPTASDVRGVRLGILDNQTNRANYNPDLARIEQRIVAHNLVPEQVGFTQAELRVVPAEVVGGGGGQDGGTYGEGGGAAGGGVGRCSDVRVHCKDEREQQRVFEMLVGMGLQCSTLNL